MHNLTQTEIKIKNQQLEVVNSSIREVKLRLEEATNIFNATNKSNAYGQSYGPTAYEMVTITNRLDNIQDALKSLEARRSKLIDELSNVTFTARYL